MEIPVYQSNEDKLEPLQSKIDDNEDFFNNYEEERDIEEVESYYTDKLVKLHTTLDEDCSPVIYLTAVEELPTPEENVQPELTCEEKINQLVKVEALTQEQKREATCLLNKFKGLFATSLSQLGQYHNVQHEIDTGDARPIKQSAYRIAPDEQEFLNKEIESLLKNGLISKIKSPWTSPVVIVPKKNGKLWLCVDYCKLNAVTKKDAYPLPRIDDLLETFGKAEWFSSLDLASGYWQIRMKKDDREKTAFVTRQGTYAFNVMPFGLCNAPATFQRTMNNILYEDIRKNVAVYLDDIIIYSRTYQDHILHLVIVLAKISAAGLKLNPKKCELFQNSITFLEHIVGKERIRLDEEKVSKVKNFPIPVNLRQLRTLLGLSSYYR